MTRFVVFQFEDEWLVTYADQRQISFASRDDAEHSAFRAADRLAARGQAVSVLIIPNGTPPETVNSVQTHSACWQG